MQTNTQKVDYVVHRQPDCGVRTNYTVMQQNFSFGKLRKKLKSVGFFGNTLGKCFVKNKSKAKYSYM